MKSESLDERLRIIFFLSRCTIHTLQQNIIESKNIWRRGREKNINIDEYIFTL